MNPDAMITSMLINSPLPVALHCNLHSLRSFLQRIILDKLCPEFVIIRRNTSAIPPSPSHFCHSKEVPRNWVTATVSINVKSRRDFSSFLGFSRHQSLTIMNESRPSLLPPNLARIRWGGDVHFGPETTPQRISPHVCCGC